MVRVISLRTPSVEELPQVFHTMSEWQSDADPVPLQPGDLGWQQRFGAAANAASIRIWSEAKRPVAIGMYDANDGVARLSIAPDVVADERLSTRLVDALPAEMVQVEARFGGVIRGVLAARGWVDDELWSPLRRDLSRPVGAPGLDSGFRVELVGPSLAVDRVAVQRAAFDNSTFTVQAWHEMAAGPAYVNARCLIGYAGDVPVAAATVWSAGVGRPGLLEPVGVHRDHRRRGYGREISLAAAKVLAELGSSSANVCTPTTNVAAVGTYVSAGFTPLPPVPDLRRGVANGR